MDPYEFQELVADLFKAMGYYASWVAPPGKDGGLDIVAYPDPLRTRPPRIKVQVKRQQQRINADGVRSFVSLVNEETLGCLWPSAVSHATPKILLGCRSDGKSR